MIDNQELAIKRLSALYTAETISRGELIYEIFQILKSGLIKFSQACEYLKLIDPNTNTQRFMDVVYGLYLYLHPNVVTSTRCLRSEGEFGVLATRLIEDRFTNRFDPTYMENSGYLVRYVDAYLKPVFENENLDQDQNPDQNLNQDQNPKEIDSDLEVINWIIQLQRTRLENNLEYYDNPLDSFGGLVPLIIQTLKDHRVECHADAFNFIARLKSIMLEIHRLTQFMEKQRSLKSVEIPRVVAQNSYDMIMNLLKVEANDQQFMIRFKADLDSLKMSDEIYRIALEFVNDGVYRSFYHLGDWIKEFFLEDDEIPIEKDDENLDPTEHSEFSVCCDRNRGKEYYAYRIKNFSTTEMTAEQIHEFGQKEVARLQSQILKYTQEHSKTQDSEEPQTIEEGVEYLRKMQNDIYPDTEEGQKQVLEDAQNLEAKIREYLPKLFKPNSYSESKCEYRFVPNHQKDTSPPGYYLDPSFDGKTPGVFYMNLRSEILRFEFPTLLAHEVIPGHHLERSTAAESDLHPLRKVGFYTNFVGYVEGWALYTETLCRELGLFDRPDTMLGHLLDQLLRAVRLVIDTGIHHYGWTRSHALEYMNDNCPFPLKNNEIEIDRYISDPGQALAYSLGQKELLDLRQESDLSLEEFNTRVLQKGPVPLSFLRDI